jgi:hypothetical protein
MVGNALRAIVCWIILTLHVATIITSPYFIVDFSEAMDVILILMPLTGLYVGVVVNFYANQKDRRKSDTFSTQFASLTIFLVFFFSVALIGVQYLYYANHIGTLGELKRAVGIIDTGLGVYTGFLVKALFR